ncbi:MAG: hypothetical protein AAF074_14225 [Pseudomonadota bacterium]
MFALTLASFLSFQLPPGVEISHLPGALHYTDGGVAVSILITEAPGDGTAALLDPEGTAGQLAGYPTTVLRESLPLGDAEAAAAEDRLHVTLRLGADRLIFSFATVEGEERLSTAAERILANLAPGDAMPAPEGRIAFEIDGLPLASADGLLPGGFFLGPVTVELDALENGAGR